ncbi:DoxX family protein [Candidatus Pacearchaeota archaeon]|nr:DoxX family protein [Candidatus Pacearchaeota archaeon]
MISNYLNRNKHYFYFTFRILVGFLFFVHGAQKLFGWFASKGTYAITTQLGLAGIIEIFVGILIIIGLFTRYAAILGALLMIAAYYLVPMKRGLWPWQNGGELAIIYFLIFLVFIALGAGKLALDNYIFEKTKEK